jgi:hypothetical protein
MYKQHGGGEITRSIGRSWNPLAEWQKDDHKKKAGLMEIAIKLPKVLRLGLVVYLMYRFLRRTITAPPRSNRT